MTNKPTLSTNRRRFLSVVGLAALGSAGAAGTASASHDEDDGDDAGDGGYSVSQDDQCTAVEPFAGDESAEEFYNWDMGETDYSAAGATELQEANTSVLFLYRDDDDDVYLVLIHGELSSDEADGGSVTLEFENMPDDGEWVVRDDFYDAPSRYDRWQVDQEPQVVDWTWDDSRTDGGVFGPLGDDVEITVNPAFNEEAALYGEHYEGTIEEWKVLSGDLDDPDETTLDMDESIQLRTGGCEGGSDGGDDGDDDEKTYTRDEIAQAKYGYDFDELSIETTGEVQELYNRQPFDDGLDAEDVLTRDELAQERYDSDFDELARAQRIAIENDFDAQFGELPSDPRYTRDEIAHAKYDHHFPDLSVETTGEVQELYNRQPFADDLDAEDVLTRDELAQERYDSDFDELGRSRRVEIQNAFDAQFEATADAA